MGTWVSDAVVRGVENPQPVQSGGSSMIPAIIGGAASLGGAALGGKAADKASKAQLQAQRESLAYAKEQEAQRRLMYDSAKKQYDQQVADWYASRNALLKNLGSDVTLGAGGMPAAGGAAVGPAASPSSAPLGATIADILREKGSLEGVFDWGPRAPTPRGV